MPIDRNKMLRYKILNECFRDMSRQYRIGDLLDCVNRELKRYDLNTVSRRTVQKDLQDLQMEPHNVEFDEVLRESNCYRYADTSFSLELLQLTPKDRDALARTIEVLLERYSDHPLYPKVVKIWKSHWFSALCYSDKKEALRKLPELWSFSLPFFKRFPKLFIPRFLLKR